MNERSRSSFSSSPHPDARQLGRWFTAARREGLLALLPTEVWQTLSAILSFTDRDGRRSFTLDQLAVALGLPRERAHGRLEQLTGTEWQGQPLATLECDPQGEVVGAVLAPIESLNGARAPAPDPADTGTPEQTAGADETELDGLVADLQEIGLNPEQIARLLGNFPRPRIRRQMEWLPARQARNPAALLIRAVEQDWGAPREAA